MFPVALVFQASFISQLYCQSFSTYKQYGQEIKQAIPITGFPDSSAVGIWKVELVQQPVRYLIYLHI